MNNIKEKHKKIAVFITLLTIVWLSLYFFWIRKLQVRNTQLETKNSQLKQTLLKQTNKLSVNVLNRERDYLMQKKIDSQRKLIEVFKRSEIPFKQIIDPYNEKVNLDSYKGLISALDFQTDFETIKTDLSKKGVYLDEMILQLSEEYLKDKPYRHVIQIALVKKIVDMALQNKLKVNSHIYSYPTEFNLEEYTKKGIRPALITVLPVRHYYVDNSSDIYLEEYPIKVTLRGQVNNLCEFLISLTNKDNFIPLDSIELKRISDDIAKPTEWDGVVQAEIVLTPMMNVMNLEDIKIQSMNRVVKHQRGF